MWYIVTARGKFLVGVQPFGLVSSNNPDLALSFETKEYAEAFIGCLVNCWDDSSLYDSLHLEFCDE